MKLWLTRDRDGYCLFSGALPVLVRDADMGDYWAAPDAGTRDLKFWTDDEAEEFFGVDNIAELGIGVGEIRRVRIER